MHPGGVQPRSERLCTLCSQGIADSRLGSVGDEFHVVFECAEQEVPRRMHAALFESFGGWADLSPGSLSTDAMRQFMGQNARLVASFIHACAMRASEQPPDDVMFGDAIEAVAEADEVDEAEAHDESSADDFQDVLDFALDSLLEVDGFFPVPP